MTVEMITQVHRHRLLEARAAPGCLIDLWEWSDDREQGASTRTGIVVTVMTGQEQAAEPFHGWAGIYGYAVVPVPAEDPVERLQEAIRQAHQRHEHRHADAQFSEARRPGL